MDSLLTLCVLYVACLLVALHCSTAQGKLALIAAGYEIIGRAGYRPNGIISIMEKSKLGSEWNTCSLA